MTAGFFLHKTFIVQIRKEAAELARALHGTSTTRNIDITGTAVTRNPTSVAYVVVLRVNNFAKYSNLCDFYGLCTWLGRRKLLLVLVNK